MLKQAREIISRINAWRKQNPLVFGVYLVGLVILTILTLILIETIRQENTGLEDKSLWDWLDLIIVPLVVALALFWLNTSQKKREDQRQIDSQQQSILQAYYDKMSELLLDKGLGADDAESSEKAVVVARALTLSAFRNLDPDRNAAILRFLGDAGLLIGEKILHDDDMRKVNFSGSDLSRANLSGATLYFSNLRGATLIGADLRGANLFGANLREALLITADLRMATLPLAFLSAANLGGANLRMAILAGAFLSEANLHGANLSVAILAGADLREADLSEADLRQADLRKANLSEANLHIANLRGAFYTEDTRWPDNFNPKEVGAILVDDNFNPKEAGAILVDDEGNPIEEEE